ncbi:hypothetical protein [Nitrosomonas communis]|uniref:Uncharacterized protein n=1 Tax=Nitrosomonas communis TaxID=44574 RepID=A0A1H2X3M1_9PROT|nr:hypothetical protein [Nitrosomonas communis]SDW87336.1 hypothetical protein SAMN05421882_103413 [Nitrosomonas communis]
MVDVCCPGPARQNCRGGGAQTAPWHAHSRPLRDSCGASIGVVAIPCAFGGPRADDSADLVLLKPNVTSLELSHSPTGIIVIVRINSDTPQRFFSASKD